jgi:hypothetical protein
MLERTLRSQSYCSAASDPTPLTEVYPQTVRAYDAVLDLSKLGCSTDGNVDEPRCIPM